MATNSKDEINLEPDYDFLFATFEREAKIRAESILRCPDFAGPTLAAVALREVQGLLAPLNICAQSATNRATILRYRDLIAEVASKIEERATSLERNSESGTDEVPHCDQCQMLNINGVNCHETGCPNQGCIYEDGEWVKYVECSVCGCEVREGESCGCSEDQE